MACRSRGLVVFKALLKFMHNWMDTLSGRWGVYLEKPVVTKELAESRHSGSNPSFGFFLLLTCAAILAVLSLSFALITGDLTLYKRSGFTVLFGILITIALAGCTTALLPFYVGGDEITSRTQPTLVDFIIALVAGVAAAFSLTRRSIANSIAGVAIAVALVPPFCVVGIGWFGVLGRC